MRGWRGTLCDRFKCRYDLAENRLLTVDEMYSFDWQFGGDAWK